MNQSDLLRKARSYQISFSERKTVAKAVKTAFLCHSHQDVELVKGLIVWFQEEEIDLYIDWMDATLPDTPSAETAKRLKEKIEFCNWFFFLATGNSVVSRWCPWEIGYADSSKKSVVIIPTYDSIGKYGNEYLELYHRIDFGRSNFREGLALFEAGSKNGFSLVDHFGKM